MQITKEEMSLLVDKCMQANVFDKKGDVIGPYVVLHYYGCTSGLDVAFFENDSSGELQEPLMLHFTAPKTPMVEDTSYKDCMARLDEMAARNAEKLAAKEVVPCTSAKTVF